MRNLFMTVLSAVLCFAGCSLSNNSLLFDRGEGVVTFHCSTSFGADSLNLWYYIPEGKQAKMPVQIVMHGNDRNPKDYLDSWKYEADKYGFALLVPEFDAQQYPEGVYHQGNVVNEGGNFSSKDELVYNVLNSAFRFFVDNSRVKAESYNIYGHSAGGQFVHRFMQFGDTRYVAKAVAANSGWYTLPTDTLDYPYGQGGAKARLGLSNEEYYSKDMVILLGTVDTVRSLSLRQTPEADQQGRTRLARGEFFFGRAKAEAASLGCEFGWTKRYAPEVGHSNEKMAPMAASIIYEEPAGLHFDATPGVHTTYCVPKNVFSSYPLPVQYFIPKDFNPKTATIMLNCHGGARHNIDSIKEFVDCADENNIVLIGVDFPEKEYPNSIFLYGGFRDDDGGYRTMDNSIYAIIDDTITEMRRQLKIKTDKYDIYGHSAGSQTAQRFMLFYDKSKVNRVFAANCGWYTFPDVNVEYPYGIKDCAEFYGLDLKEYLAAKMTIAVGTADTLINFGLRMNDFTLKQGANRYERGISFYNYGKQLSEELGCPFNWDLVYMQDIGHDEPGAVRNAQMHWFGRTW